MSEGRVPRSHRAPDTDRAMRQYQGWIVVEVVTLENGTTALEIRSPDGTETTLVTPATALTGLED